MEVSVPPAIESEESMSLPVLAEEQKELRMMRLNSALNQQQHQESVEPLTVITEEKHQDPVRSGRRVAKTQLSEAEKYIFNQQARRFNNHNIPQAGISQQCRASL